jgi:Protein of unknown function (DUF4011)/REase_MTES_1575/AAA domain/Protein of unknown function (DUF3320)
MTDRDSVVFDRIEDWRRRLIDLSYRNRLIKYRPTQASTIEIEAPDLNELLADPGRPAPWRFYFPPDPDEKKDAQLELDASDFVDEAVVRTAQRGDRAPRPNEIVAKGEDNPRRINRILENLARKSNAEFQDKALRILYVAAGFLDWVDPTRDEFLSSPLILVPVELRRESAGHPYALYFVGDEEVVVNPSLTEKLRRDVKLGVPEEWAWEDKPISVELDEIEEAVSERGWTVRREAVLGLFSFQKFVMYRDLLDNEQQIAAHPAIRSLARQSLVDELSETQINVPVLEELDDAQPPRADHSILDADATQRRCIEACRRGQSFVMQGPPGTGKSQTIANVIADAIGRGKRILFVSEKAAALEVVHKRLAAQGLDEFCLLLHGEHAARREVVESLHHSLTGEIVPRSGMSAHELDRLAQLRELLNSSAQLLHLPMPKLADRSLWDVLGDLAELHNAPSVPSAPEASPIDGVAVRSEFQSLDEIFQRLDERWAVSPRDFPWRDYEGERFSVDQHGTVLATVRALGQDTRLLVESAGDAARLLGWPLPINLRAVDRLMELGQHLLDAPAVAAHWLTPGAADRIEADASAAEKTFGDLATSARAFRDLYPTRPSSDFPEDPYLDLGVALGRLDEVAGRTTIWDSQLLGNLPDALSYLADAPTLIQTLSSDAREAARQLGQPADVLTLERVGELSELAALAFQGEDRPERDWLVRAGFERLRAALDETRDTFERYQGERSRLLIDYTETVLEADIVGLLKRFTSEYVSALSKFKSGYRRDARAVKALRRDQKLPKTVIGDLEELVKLQALGRELDEASPRLSRAFGSYYRGRDTDLSAIDRAAHAAEQAMSVAAPNSDLEVLAGQICVGSVPNALLAQLADRLSSGLSRLSSGLEQRRPFVARARQLFDRVALDVLAERLELLRGAIDGVAALSDELARGSAVHIADLPALIERARLIRQLHAAETTISERDSGWDESLTPYYRAANTDWDPLRKVVSWLKRFEELAGGAVPSQLAAKLLSADSRWPDIDGLVDARRRYLESAEAVAALFSTDRRQELLHFTSLKEFSEIEALCAQLELHVDDLFDWIEFSSWRGRARERGWGDFLDALILAEVGHGQVVTAFRRAFWNRRLEALFDEDPDLADRGSTYARWIEEFRELDRKLVRTAADRLIAARNQQRPAATVSFRGSQVDLLRREAAKIRRHLPVRKLLATIPSLLSELKPCLMMSPLTVSHFLSPQHEFDLVIFDEASQVPPQDAINCIYRGKQLIVAGDSRQLPPTPFFQVAEAEEVWSDAEDEVAEDMESILDSCEALLPQHPLRWHYRSRHEHLIAFSNAHVYNETLHTFPSADAFSPWKGISFINVPDGIYDRGKTKTNRREARVVAQRVISHLSGGRRSVGVIAFNTQQANAIDEELDRLRIEHPELESYFAGDRLDRVFVKHLESVQGDERDVIVFSVGFGRDADGKFTMNFGPINKEGGYRRLNVAVTRARDLVEVVSSVRAADFTLSETSGRGARLLQEYIRYAETGGESLAETERAQEQTSTHPLMSSIGDAVTELGYEPVYNVGVGSFRVDVGVHDKTRPEGYALGIVTDGPAYSVTPTARDRDRLREEVLTKELKWQIHRIWSLDWVRNRQAEIARLEHALEEEATHPAAPEQQGEFELPARERTERLVPDLQHAFDSMHFDWVVEYERAELPRVNTGYEFHESANRDHQRDLIVQLVQIEAPIHIDSAIFELARAFGYQRTSNRIWRAARQAIDMAVRKRAVELRGDFIWRPSQELTVVRTPGRKDPIFRDIEAIPPEEIDLAFEKLMEAGATEEAELIPVVAKILGFDRVGPRIRPILVERLAAIADKATHG